MYQKVITVINKTAENTSSMRQDVLNHRKTEIDYMNGYMIKLARQHSLASPVNAQLTQQVKSLLPV
jgi:2-dehydropantoate 2-reductase